MCFTCLMSRSVSRMVLAPSGPLRPLPAAHKTFCTPSWHPVHVVNTVLWTTDVTPPNYDVTALLSWTARHDEQTSHASVKKCVIVRHALADGWLLTMNIMMVPEDSLRQNRPLIVMYGSSSFVTGLMRKEVAWKCLYLRIIPFSDTMSVPKKKALRARAIVRVLHSYTCDKVHSRNQ